MIKRYYATKDNTITNAFQENLSTRGTGSNMGASDIVEVFSIYGQQSSVIKTFFPVAPLVVFVFGSSCWHEAMVGRTPAWHNGVTPYYANFSLALYCWKIYCILVIFNSRTSSHIPHLDNS